MLGCYQRVNCKDWIKGKWVIISQTELVQEIKFVLLWLQRKAFHRKDSTSSTLTDQRVVKKRKYLKNNPEPDQPYWRSQDNDGWCIFSPCKAFVCILELSKWRVNIMTVSLITTLLDLNQSDILRDCTLFTGHLFQLLPNCSTQASVTFLLQS